MGFRCQRCSGLIVGSVEPSCINCGASPLTQQEIDNVMLQLGWEESVKRRRGPSHGGKAI